MFHVGIAGFLHESNTFLPQPTTYDDFAATSLTRGAALLERWQGASHELGGMLHYLTRQPDVAVVPLLATFAVPSGAIAASAYNRIVAELIEQLTAAPPLDGLLIALHGATVAENHPDADGELLRRLRALLGPTLPIGITFDLHANLSPAMAQLSTFAIGYRTNPHLDQFARGVDAAELLLRTLRGEIRPCQALVSPPLLIRNSCQHTAAPPAKILYDALAETLRAPAILSASIAMGFPHADVAEMGAHFLAVAHDNPSAAHRAAHSLATLAWNHRHQFTGALDSPAGAVAAAARATETPVVLLDCGDNVGGGAAANSTAIFHELLRQQVPNALIVLYDPAAVARCLAAGVRQSITLAAGEPPLAITGRVRTLHDGCFEETEVRHGGWTQNDQGITAVVETAERHTIVLTSRRMAPFSLEQLLSLGIHPERKRVLVVKGVIAPRAAYEPVARQFILVDSPGATADNPALLPYRHRRRPLFPLEPAAEWVS
jgi:microcystin degradation protein MlrC